MKRVSSGVRRRTCAGRGSQRGGPSTPLPPTGHEGSGLRPGLLQLDRLLPRHQRRRRVRARPHGTRSAISTCRAASSAAPPATTGRPAPGCSASKATSTGPTSAATPSSLCALGCETSNSWLGTVRGRVGYAFDRFLPYVTGGFAVGDIEATAAVLHRQGRDQRRLDRRRRPRGRALRATGP